MFKLIKTITDLSRAIKLTLINTEVSTKMQRINALLDIIVITVNFIEIIFCSKHYTVTS